MSKEKEDAVYRFLTTIPKGKAATYGGIGRRLRINPREVGRILSINEHPSEYPCYKVVRADGSLGGYTMYGKNDESTLAVKKRKLLADGVLFCGKRVDRASLIL